MCDCKSVLESKLLERAKQQLPDSTGHHVEIEGYAFAITGNTMVSRQYLPVVIKHTVVVKKTGQQKKKKKQVQKMLASYCMFCGEKQTKEAE